MRTFSSVTRPGTAALLMLAMLLTDNASALPKTKAPTKAPTETTIEATTGTTTGTTTEAKTEAKTEPTTSILPVKGLRQDVQIMIDTWGVPHIYAKEQADLFFAQGFNAARDRLFQIDLWRRRGLGETAAVFGERFIEQDRAARLFLYRGPMAQEWRAYGQGAAQIATQFVAGINAYIDFLESHPESLPFEFKALNYRPAKWRAEDVVRIRSHGLARNLVSEVARAQQACSGNLAADQIRSGLQPPWETVVPAGLDPCLPADVLRVFSLATQPMVFDPATLTLGHAGASLQDQDPTMEGSNNWVIAAKKSATGRPVLANDPHRAISLPSLRYLAHLSAPGLDVIGAGEPALPGISIGHNGKIAFGLTIFGMDQEDLYVYELDPAQPQRYRYRDRWEEIRVIKERIAVRGGTVREVELEFTRHGPIIHTDNAKQRAYAVRSGWLEAGMAPYFGSIEYMRAKTYAGFKKAMAHWGAPAENQVVADTLGNIGWVAGGLAPIRPNWDGLLPVPGDGRYEWAGFWRGDQLPSLQNPAQGWFASANEMNLPADYPYARYKLGFEWSNNSRMKRIAEVLGQPGKLRFEDSLRLQTDQVSIPARRLLALLNPLSTSDPATRKGLALLKDWQGEQSPDSAAAALFEVWWSRRLIIDYVDLVAGRNLKVTPDVAVMLDLLENPDARFGAAPGTRRDQLLLNSLGNAVADMEKLQGSDPKAWRWGKLHISYFVHPLSALADPDSRQQINVGPYARGGSAYTVNQSGYRAPDFTQTHGASVRLVLDVGEWDNSRAINTPGQSGDPGNPHYRDLAPLWAKGEYFPLLYSSAAVRKNARQVIILKATK